MKPRNKSIKTLYYTQSQAKAIEFSLTKDESASINYPTQPEELFIFVVGLMGDIARDISKNRELSELSMQNARFCASFFDSLQKTTNPNKTDDYLLLIGSAAYYFANMPGSAKVLADKIDPNQLNLNANQLDCLLICILKNDFCQRKFESQYSDLANQIIQSLRCHFENGSDIENLLEICRLLKTKALYEGNPRDLFFASLIYATNILKIARSSWRNLPKYSNLSKDLWSHTIQKKDFIKELWPAQLLLGDFGVYSGQSAVIQMPTSAGKTKSTELIIRSAFLSKRTNIAAIVAPFKSLCNELRIDFFKCFRNEHGITVDSVGDALETDSFDNLENNKQHVVIFTPEKLYYLLSQQQDFVSKIGLVIFDEGHLFDDYSRGTTYELLLTELKSLLPDSAQIILISAVMHNANQIAAWLNKSCKVVHGNNLYPAQRSLGYVYKQSEECLGIQYFEKLSISNKTYFIPYAIKKDLYYNNGEVNFFPDFKNPRSIALKLAINLSNKGCTTIFFGQKKYLKNFLKEAIEQSQRSDFKDFICDPIEKNKIVKLIFENIGDESIIYQSAKIGIFSHFSDIPLGIKQSIELAAHESKINTIACTSTLAQGINLPIRYLLIPSSWNGRERISVRDFHNLLGRVARAGKLTEGSIIFTNPEIATSTHLSVQTDELLNPEKCEDCSSSLLNFFNDYGCSYQKNKIKHSLSIPFDIHFLFNRYLSGLSSQQIAEEIMNSNPSRPKNTPSELIHQIQSKIHCIGQIENFILINYSFLKNKTPIEIVQMTLAYSIAGIQQHKDLENLFSLIKANIDKEMNGNDKSSTFAKSLRGLRYSKQIEEKINQEYNRIKNINDIDSFVYFFFELLQQNYIPCKQFHKYKNNEKMLNALILWVKGWSYNVLYSTLKDEKCGNTKINQEDCIEIFEHEISFEGAILVNTIQEFIKAIDPDDTNLLEKLKFFQKQIKYGLSDKKTICLYEMGFNDRVVAQKIAPLVDGQDQNSIKISLICNYDSISKAISEYPLIIPA